MWTEYHIKLLNITFRDYLDSPDKTQIKRQQDGDFRPISA